MGHLSGQYKVGAISAIKRFVRDDDICFDIGAHGGSWTRPLSRLVKRGHVYAFEAFPYYARVLKMFVRLMGMRNVTVANKAVFDRNGPITLVWRDQYGRRLTGTTHVAGINEWGTDSIVVEGITLDSLLPHLPRSSRISFIKVDVEGAELMVVRGAIDLINAFRPTIFLEVVRRYCGRYGYTPETLFRFFADRGYRAFTISHSNAGFVINVTGPASYRGKSVLFMPSELFSGEV